MEIETITTIVNSGVSFLALILSIFLKRKGASTKTLEEIADEANKKANKYIAKQCKKNKIALDTKSEDNKSDNETVSTPSTINL